MLILSTKLRNAVTKAFINPENLEFKLRNISINGYKRGCSGFIRNKANNAIVYVDTEEPCYAELHFMYRYADHMADYTGYRNRWASTLDELVNGIATLLKTPVCDARDFRV